jgi:hypothetical protein
LIVVVFVVADDCVFDAPWKKFPSAPWLIAFPPFLIAFCSKAVCRRGC